MRPFPGWTQHPGEHPSIGLLLHGAPVRTLTIGATHDTMDPAHMQAMAQAMPRGRYLHCPQGSHMAMVDDAAVYLQGLLDFLREVDAAAR